MSNALLRDVDDDLLADYRAAARRRGVSLNVELKAGLERARPRQRLSKAEKVALSKALRAMTPAHGRSDDSVAVIRGLRDRGYSGTE